MDERKNVFELIEEDSINQSSEGKAEVKPETMSSNSSDGVEELPPPLQNPDDVDYDAHQDQVTLARLAKSPSPKKKATGTKAANDSEKKTKPKRKRRVKRGGYGSDSGDETLGAKAKQLFKKYGQAAKRGQKESGNELSSGPYLKVTGLNSGSQMQCAIVNSSADGSNSQLIGRGAVLESHFYDLATCDPDMPWLCCFCRRPPYYGQLSYLYGPYNISVRCKDYLMADPHDCYAREKNFRKSKSEPDDSGPLSVWFHWECFLFTNGCYFINKLIGLDDAVKVAVKTKCSHCKQLGATLSCCSKNCSKMYHYLCGRDAGASFNEDYCTIFCQNHNKEKKKIGTD